MTVRDRVARGFSGGPPFRVQPDVLYLDINREAVSNASDVISENRLFDSVSTRLNELGFDCKLLENAGVIRAEADSLTEVIERVQERAQEFSEEVTEQLTKLRQRVNEVRSGSSFVNRTVVKASELVTSTPYEAELDSDEESSIRNRLTDISLKNSLTELVEEIDGVANAEMAFTRTTFGPRSLRVDPGILDSVMDDVRDGIEIEQTTLSDARGTLNVEKIWDEYNRGEGAVVAIFDMGFCEEFIGEERVLDTFSGDDVDSAYTTKELEGHGTMSAMAAIGNEDEGAPQNGMAPDADLLLVRISDEDGALSHTEEALDWFAGKLDEIDRPVISNHSYGTPVCSGRNMNLCESTSTEVARELANRDNHIAVYAAGNQATYCGRRLSGATNSINGINSDPSCVTVGALRSDGLEVQEYSSHGWGTCTSVREDPKPNVSAPIPSAIPYGCDVMDMSSGIGGSSGGTSTASPIVAGTIALLATEYGEADKEKIMEVVQETAELPRTTQINLFAGYDARFGNGMIKPLKAIEELAE